LLSKFELLVDSFFSFLTNFHVIGDEMESATPKAFRSRCHGLWLFDTAGRAEVKGESGFDFSVSRGDCQPKRLGQERFLPDAGKTTEALRAAKELCGLGAML
jgi:hypothetical protein